MVAAFQSSGFPADAFQEGSVPVVVAINQGLLAPWVKKPPRDAMRFTGPANGPLYYTPERARKITRKEIDAATVRFSEEQSEEEWQLILALVA